MHSALRTLSLLILCLLALTACAAPSSIASAPTSTPTPDVLPAPGAAGPANRVELAAGRYQLIMFYSPI